MVLPSYAQQQMWALARVAGAGAADNRPMAFDLRGNRHHEVFARAMDPLVVRHESLRTVLVGVGGEGHQVIGSSAIDLTLTVYGLTESENADDRLHGLMRDDPQVPFVQATAEGEDKVDCGHWDMLESAELDRIPA
ncbi:condensation domain-containing protein [Kutzneria albida]|uniref:Condensation domain-containing protein n=1 Tax=Kutzneria albida DSM 43870 TaxID=1449976 RepID=W5WFC7_9PSEU|nr:condensation domain-containing protein [Kutzneria albida]AHH99286.1 hypothetical protein KALB_5925 [Kutzneria albida DSM 43870]